MRFVVPRLLETYVFPKTSKVLPVGLVPTPIFELKMSDETFPVPTFDEFTNKFVVVKALDAQKFPETSSVFPVDPIPMVVVTISEKAFRTPDTFESPVETFVVVSAFEAMRFAPWTEFAEKTDVFIRVTFAPPEKRFPKGTETFPIVEETDPMIFPKVVVVP